MMPTLEEKLRLRSSNPTPKYLKSSCGSAFASVALYNMNPEKKGKKKKKK
jgi:hypothetical protein